MPGRWGSTRQPSGRGASTARRCSGNLDEGARLGVTGTPGFFINGRPLSGAQPLEAFVRVIEEELLARKAPSVGAR